MLLTEAVDPSDSSASDVCISSPSSVCGSVGLAGGSVGSDGGSVGLFSNGGSFFFGSVVGQRFLKTGMDYSPDFF